MGIRLIVNADDFGRSRAVNEAVVRAHQEGILTSASLMIGGDAADDAVEQARRLPRLGVGLHLTLVQGRPVLGPALVPGLVGPDGSFTERPIWAGFRYYFDRRLRVQLAAEIEAQRQRFEATGLPLDHINSHLHLHLHPVILGIVIRQAPAAGPLRLRVTQDPLLPNLRAAGQRWGSRIANALVFTLLAASARRRLHRRDARSPRGVFGLLQNGRVDERFLLRLIPQLSDGDWEVYSHPTTEGRQTELDGLTSPAVRALVANRRIQLVRYLDL
jgi:chitin disaccharide deacetylase